jgi:hypothetical protein
VKCSWNAFKWEEMYQNTPECVIVLSQAHLKPTKTLTTTLTVTAAAAK